MQPKGAGTIRIDSILGGLAPTSHFASETQFRASLGIDPAQPSDDADSVTSTVASGLIRPVASEKFSSTTVLKSPLWIVTNPKDSNIYVYDAQGSAYTVNATLTTVTALVDGGTLTSSLGNGCEYYDNYIYFAKNTDVARYGPLNGAAAFDGDYWTGNLAKTALVNTAYPTTFKNNLQVPNHPMYRHSDGILYFGDVVGNQGNVHYIRTTKTTVEGDTDNTSTYGALTFGYGLWPTSIQGYGSNLAVALYEGSSTGLRQKHAKIAFWDTTSTSSNTITWVEYPDAIITAMKNVNGVLYVVSGNYQTRGFRVTRFVGGYSFEEVYYSETGEPCLQGAIDGTLNRVVFGSHTTVPEADGCLYSIGLQKAALGSGLFNIMRSTGSVASTSVTAVAFADSTELGFYSPIIGWSQGSDGSTGASYGLDKQGTSYSAAPPVFWSQVYRIGKLFRIKKIRIPLAQAVAASMTLIAKVYTDSAIGTTYTLATINNTNYPNSDRVINLRASSGGAELWGRNNFWLELRWTGAALLTVDLPIIIEYEVFED